MTDTEFDKGKAEAFAGQTLEVLTGGILSLMLSIGHRTGLFETMAKMPPSTSQEIAERSGLNERYVREWLGSMVTGKIIAYDKERKTYWLPPEHAASLTKSAGPGNLAILAQYTAIFGTVEDRVVRSFRKGGGVPYSAYPVFHRIQAEASAEIHDMSLINVSLPLVTGIVERLRSGIDVLDVACGSGHAINLMAKAFPKSRFTGYDFSRIAIAAAKKEARKLGLSNATFSLRDVARIDEPEGYDFVTAFDAIHDQAKPTKVLVAISKSLRPGGAFLMVDIAASSNLEENMQHPLAPILYGVSTMHCMTVSLALKGEGLGTVWGEQKATSMLNEAGFSEVSVKRVPGDILNNYYIARKA